MIGLMLDSGAHSLYNMYVKSYHGAYDWDFSYSETDEFWKYAEDYATYLKLNSHKFETVVNLDVIRNPERSWAMQKWYENKGLKVLPVYHFGEPIEWFKKYMDNYEYIGISGLGQEIQRENYIQYADRVFNLICDSKGNPKWKIHGFAMTSIDLILRYPFYSVDSTTWLVGEKFSLVCIPIVKNGKFDFGVPPRMVSVTSRRTKHTSKAHIKNLPKAVWYTLFKMCEEAGGYTWGKSEFKQVQPFYSVVDKPGEFWVDKKKGIVEVVIEPGISNDMGIRNSVIAYYFAKMEEYINNHPRVFKRDILQGFYD